MKKISQNNEYVHDVPVSISGGKVNGDIEPTSKRIPIRFKIDFEARSWGIKGVTIALLDSMLQVPVIIKHWEGDIDREEEKTIVVDLTKLRQSYIQSSGLITLGDLEIVLEEDLSVNYRLSSLEIIT